MKRLSASDYVELGKMYGELLLQETRTLHLSENMRLLLMDLLTDELDRQDEM